MATEPGSATAFEESTSAGNAEYLSSGPTGGPGSTTTSNQDVRVPHQIEPDPFAENQNEEQTHLPHYVSAGYNYSCAVT